MIAFLYGKGLKKSSYYEENVLVKPKALVLVPARINLRAVIKSKRNINIYKTSLFEWDRDVPPLFWSENLVSEENPYIFETKYCTEYDDILPISYLNKIPERLAKIFLRKTPPRISELADKLVGKEKDTKKLLKKFYEFVAEHEKPLPITLTKPIEQLVDEYDSKGYFYGNCKEARDFYAALCNSKGFPTKQVIGTSSNFEGHTWVDVFVPSKEGYKLLPVDPALNFFGSFSRKDHLFTERVPNVGSFYYLLGFINKNYKLKLRIEAKD